jgi:hypothetical protein
MRAKTVIANREPQPLLRRGARSACRLSHIASTTTAEEGPTNRRTHRVVNGGRSTFAHSPSPCCCGSDHRGEADTIAFHFYA